jgi:hypothetical protein
LTVPVDWSFNFLARTLLLSSRSTSLRNATSCLSLISRIIFFALGVGSSNNTITWQTLPQVYHGFPWLCHPCPLLGSVLPLIQIKGFSLRMTIGATASLTQKDSIPSQCSLTFLSVFAHRGPTSFANFSPLVTSFDTSVYGGSRDLSNYGGPRPYARTPTGGASTSGGGGVMLTVAGSLLPTLLDSSKSSPPEIVNHPVAPAVQ